jgi:acyl carrier protein
MTDDSVQVLTGFALEHLVPDEVKGQFDADSPLLEWGILDSLRTAMLLNFIRRELGVAVPPSRIDPVDFASIRRIAMLVADVRAAGLGSEC